MTRNAEGGRSSDQDRRHPNLRYRERLVVGIPVCDHHDGYLTQLGAEGISIR